ncbi:hypothetical protein DOT_1824 [Desulfosporosinus sp. OT]|nr:hypothetical protein DOT_1824 [Desulfosporosinus sp. OT]
MELNNVGKDVKYNIMPIAYLAAQDSQLDWFDGNLFRGIPLYGAGCEHM